MLARVHPCWNPLRLNAELLQRMWLLTQRELAQYLVEERNANYHFTVKANQPTLFEDISFHFQNKNTPKAADLTHTGNGEHGGIKTRKIWVTSALNHYLDFPYVRQAFMIEKEFIRKKTGKISREVVYGITSVPASHATPEQILRDSRSHWSIVSCHYIIDWNYDEDRSQIRSGFGPENITRLRRFAIGLLKNKKQSEAIPEMMKKLVHPVNAYFGINRPEHNGFHAAP